MGYGSVFTLLAEFRKRFGFSETELGIITAVGFFAGFVAQIGLARYADRGYTKHLIWAGIASATFGMLALTVADQYWQFVAARTLLGLGSGAVAPALRRLIISRDPEHLGENLGKLTAMEITGFVLGLPLQRYWPRPAMNQITESVSLEREGDVALVVVNNPPVNALSSHVRQGIFDAMTQAQESDATAIVLICEGRTFIAGADITEFGAGMGSGASLSDAQQAMENNTKPVVAAIHGTALGGGLEVGAVCALPGGR
ncbi:Peroxisomal bifunctional enzyme [Nymphon striatum]|nr:Peroxisomal bifunctional enzyme [Nymphon striatum]